MFENSKQEDNLIWERIKKGDIKSYQDLYDHYIVMLFSFGMQYVDDDETVKDAIQDVFLNLYNSRKNLSSGSVNIKNYLFTALKRQIFKNTKKLKKNHTLKNEEELESLLISSTEDEMINDEIYFEKTSILATALATLTEKQRYALQLRFYDGLSYEEMAKILDISENSCRTMVYRTLKIIREKI